MPPVPRILLAEDEQIVRQGVRALLEQAGFEIVAEASDGREAIRLAEQHQPDIAVLDLAMPNMNGTTAAQELARVAPGIRVVALTAHCEDEQVLAALEAGIEGYVLKTEATADLVRALREVARGRTYLSPGISRTVVDASLGRRRRAEDPLTPREREVLQLVAEGKATKEVAQLLGISVKTAEFHRSRLMGKLGIHETASLVRYAIRKGIVQP
jgi:two-component system, NarL family, response regulator NreC